MKLSFGLLKSSLKEVCPCNSNGWSMKNNTMTQPPPASDPRGGTFCSRCLFDLLADEGEHVNIAADHPEIVEKLAAQLATYGLKPGFLS